MAENNASMTISVSYNMYIEHNGKKELVESTTPEEPFVFTTGLGFAFEAFEEKFKTLKTGDEFNFTLTKDEANGDRNEEFVIDVDKNIFVVDGKFDDEHIAPGKVVPLMNAEGQHMNGLIVEVKEDKVTVDLNHPLAGKDLIFEGKVLEMHEATKEEIQALLNMITGQGGCSGCSGCGCDGECGGESHSSCGCGEHEGGCGCH